MNVKKMEKDGIVRAYPENGKPLAWSASSGVELIEKDGLYFKDLEKTGELLPYEDWRLPVEERAADLASRLTTEEIAGLMLYSPHQAVPPMAFGPFGGTYNGQKYAEANVPAYTLTDQQKEFMNKEHIRHVLMITVEDAKTAAKWNNELQKLAESMPHGIPVNISSDPRNGARGSLKPPAVTSASGRRVSVLLRALTPRLSASSRRMRRKNTVRSASPRRSARRLTFAPSRAGCALSIRSVKILK